MAPNQLMLAQIQVIQDMELVDKYLGQCYSLKEGDRQFFVTLLPMFTDDAQNIMTKMDTLLKENTVDFAVLYEVCVQLLGGAACVGAIQLRNACTDLCHAAKYCSKSWCLFALDDVKREYAVLKPHLDELLQLEHAIIAEENRQAAGDQ